MNRLIYLSCILFILIFINQPLAVAQKIISIDTDTVITCPAKPSQIEQPAFIDPNCHQGSIYTVDPQNNEVWIKANLSVSSAYLQRQQPSALFVFAKMSSEVYLNGQRLGNNGTPSFLPEEEFSGDMDARFYIPPSLIKQGKNEVVIHASSHHGFLSLDTPIHFIGISEYTPTNNFFQRDLLVSASLLGAMLLGCIYISILVFKLEDKRTTIFILLMISAASGQLFLEISRALFNYSYPLHDIRLILIVILSLIFGFSFLLFSLYKFQSSNQKRWIIITVSLTLLLITVTKGFDGKSAIAILVPAVFSVILSIGNYKKIKTVESITYLVVFSIYVLIILFTFEYFNSMYFYYIVTGMIVFFVINKTNEFSQEKKLRKLEEQQVIKLQLKLDQIAEQKSPTKLQLSCAGKIEFIPVHDIAYCKAAGDYVEIFMTDTRTSLFSGTLKGIEEKLPESFMKVHRSYLVNLDEVVLISSSKIGTSSSGSLRLKTGDEIPVSRRILPQLRNVIKKL